MKISPQSKSTSSKTSVFLKFLIKICFFPITFVENERKIGFKWISRQTFVYVIFYCGGYFVIQSSMFFVDTEMMKRISEMNVIETWAISSSSISILAITFPLILARKLNNMDLRMVWDGSLAFPRHGLKNIFCIVGLNLGSNVAIFGMFLQFNISLQTIVKLQLIIFLGNSSFVNMTWITNVFDWYFQMYFWMRILANFYQIIFWMIPLLLVQCWIDKFNEDSKTQPVLYICQYYQKLSAAFSYFLFLIYLIIQIISINNIFLSITKFVQKEETINVPEYLTFSGFMISLGELLGNIEIKRLLIS